MTRLAWLLAGAALLLVLLAWVLADARRSAAQARWQAAHRQWQEVARMTRVVGRGAASPGGEDIHALIRQTLAASGQPEGVQVNLVNRSASAGARRVELRLGGLAGDRLAAWSQAWAHACPHWRAEECELALRAAAQAAAGPSFDVTLLLVEREP